MGLLVSFPEFTDSVFGDLANKIGESYTSQLHWYQKLVNCKNIFLYQLIFHHQYQFRFRKSKAGASLATKYFRVSLLYYRYDVIAVPPLHFSFYDVHMTEDNLKSPEKIW